VTIDYSVIVPVFNEEESLEELAKCVGEAFAGMGASKRYEILFVNDGSTDSTHDNLLSLAEKDTSVRWIKFRRNAGKALALMSGLRAAEGKIVVTIDGDLQDDPAEIPQLIAKIEEGYDLVTGWRQDRQDQQTRKVGSRLFNKTVNKATGLDLHDLNCGFKAFTSDVSKSLCLYGDYHRYVPVKAHLEGYKVGEVPVSNSARKYGNSKYPTFRYQGFFDLLSLLFIHRYGLNPLHFFGLVSAVFFMPSCLMIFWFGLLQIGHLMGMGEAVLNRPLLAMSLTSLMLGVVIFLTGFVCDFVLHHRIRERINPILDGIEASKRVGKT
jgi:glycosyltransferase involved in cell wall biosynthesis